MLFRKPEKELVGSQDLGEILIRPGTRGLPLPAAGSEPRKVGAGGNTAPITLSKPCPTPLQFF
jgi:hypothetical protein